MNPDETILPHNKILDIGANDIVVNPPKNVSTVELSLTPTQSLVPTAFQKSSQLSATELFTSSSLLVDSIMTDATSDQVLAELAVEPKPVEVKVDKFVEDDSQSQRFEEISLEDDSHRSRTPVSDSERKDKRRPKPFTIIVNKASPTSSVPSSPSSLTLKLSNEDLSSEGEGDAHEHQLNRQSSGPFYCVPITPAVSQKNLADTVKAQRSSSDDSMLQIRNQLPTGTRSRSLTMLDSSRPDHDHEMTRTNSHSRFFLWSTNNVHPLDLYISKTRPRDLPPKSPEEDKKHLREHEIMMRKAQRAAAKKAKNEQRKKEQRDKQYRAELNVWENEILSNWQLARHEKSTRELWWKGIPPRCRSKVWGLCIGNALAITQATYDMCLDRAFEVKSESTDGLGSPTRVDSANKMAEIFENIEKDVLTTLPALGLFQGENPLCESLRSVLEAYIFYWKDPKYISGINNIAAMFLLNMDALSSFVYMVNLSKRPCISAFFGVGEKINYYLRTFSTLFKSYNPKLYEHFKTLQLYPSLFLSRWFTSMFTCFLPLDIASRIWDCYFLHGEVFLFRAAFGILFALEPQLYGSLDETLKVLTSEPLKGVGIEKTFEYIEKVELKEETYQNLIVKEISGS